MDLFLQTDDCLSKKLKDTCNNFNNFVRIELATNEYPSTRRLNENEVKKVFFKVIGKIKFEHSKDCSIFSDNPKFFAVERDQDFYEIVMNIRKRNLREIDDLWSYKVMIVSEKMESKSLKDVDKRTLIEWISQD